MLTSLFSFIITKKTILIALSILFIADSKAEVYYVSSSQGNDSNNGLSIQSPFKSIEKLNTMQFNAGDTIYFKSGDYWEGMFWIKGSGLYTNPIVIDVYGGSIRPIINGFGYQASILIFNDQHIYINNLELYNSFSHLDSIGTTTISAETPDIFLNGPNNSWTNVYTACEIGDGNNGAQQIFSINVTNLPPQGANYRIARTVANQNWYFSPAQPLSLGPNTITVNSVNFDRTVKFQFSSGAVEFDAISLNGQNMYGGSAKKLTGFGGEENSWGSGKNVRFGIKVVASTQDLENFSFNNLYIHDIYPTPTLNSNIHKGYGIKLESQSDINSGLFNTISNIRLINTTITETGHYGFWIKSLGLIGIDSVKNNQIIVENCVFEHTGGSGFVPNKSENVLVQNCIFNHTGSSLDNRMWKRGSGMWPFDCKDVIAQHNKFMNAHGPMDSYGSHIDYGNENVVFQYNYSYNNEGGFAEILGDNINCGYRYNISVNDGYREDPNGIPWDKKGKIFWVSNFCGQNPIRCPNVGTFIYNNTVFVNDTLNPEIYFWPNIGDIHVYNNLIVAGQHGEIIPTLIENDFNELYISNNLFYDSTRINLDNDLKNNAIYADPLLFNTVSVGVNNPQLYKTQNNSPAIGNGFLINGSNDSTNYLEHNGGLDYFGNSVSHNSPSNIGAYNGFGTVDILSQNVGDLKISPSVTNNYVNISIQNFTGPIQTEIYTLGGELADIQKGNKLSFEKLKSAVYFCVVVYQEKKKTIKIIKL
ncbi:MAG: right-handed parallel beta-helix repeat-containing protein [Bacteroidota bacterium]|nr:right-handed parallel beta-helix repeat-containing protein [Bacteroidota bacterium]